MGNWNSYRYADGAWEVFGTPDEVPELSGRDLRFFVGDSDLAEVRYSPVTPPATGSAFVGQTPRSYFDDPAAPGSTDPAPEAAGLAAWAGNGVDPGGNVPLLARDDTPAPDRIGEEDLGRAVSGAGPPPVPWGGPGFRLSPTHRRRRSGRSP